MLYYYLDGLDKKGPYTAEEIINRNLVADTLVFVEGSDKWKPLSTFKELHFQKVPARAAQTQVQKEVEETLPEVKRKLKVHPIVIFLIFFLILGGVAYWFASDQRKKDYDLINNDIDAIFGGKTEVSDYRKNSSSGTLHDVITTSLFPRSDDLDVIKAANFTIAVKPTPSAFGGKNSDIYKRKLKRWNDFRQLVEYYECNTPGSFTTIHLKKESSGFAIQECWSGDMAYKVPEKIYHPGSDYGYGFHTQGYYTSTYRPAVHICYEEAAKYLTVENENKSYDPGSYYKIDRLRSLESRFYKVAPLFGERNYRIDNDVYRQTYDGRPQKLIRDSKITEATSSDDASIFTKEWIVWYRSYTNRYTIEATGAFGKYALMYCTIAAVFALVITVYIVYRNKISLQV